MKELLTRALFGKLENRLLKKYEEKYPHMKPSFSQEGEDILLERIFSSLTNGFYVDVGAHHPQRFSNTYKFYLKGWTGINIEPTPGGIDPFLTYRPRDINLSMGISDSSGPLKFYVFKEGALNTFSEETVQKLIKTTDYRPSLTIDVPMKRLDEVLETHLPKISAKNTKITFMTIDTEGFEMPVLKSNDWTRFCPSVILIEDRDFDLLNPMNSEVHRFLAEKEYLLFAKTHNTLFYRQRGWK